VWFLIRLSELNFNQEPDLLSYRGDPNEAQEIILNHDCVLEFLKSRGVSDGGATGLDLFILKIQVLFTRLRQLFFASSAKPPELSSAEDPLLVWLQCMLDPEGIDVANWTHRA
jgi:hypothetical protein